MKAPLQKHLHKQIVAWGILSSVRAHGYNNARCVPLATVSGWFPLFVSTSLTEHSHRQQLNLERRSAQKLEGGIVCNALYRPLLQLRLLPQPPFQQHLHQMLPLGLAFIMRGFAAAAAAAMIFGAPGHTASKRR